MSKALSWISPLASLLLLLSLAAVAAAEQPPLLPSPVLSAVPSSSEVDVGDALHVEADPQSGQVEADARLEILGENVAFVRLESDGVGGTPDARAVVLSRDAEEAAEAVAEKLHIKLQNPPPQARELVEELDVLPRWEDRAPVTPVEAVPGWREDQPPVEAIPAPTSQQPPVSELSRSETREEASPMEADANEPRPLVEALTVPPSPGGDGKEKARLATSAILAPALGLLALLAYFLRAFGGFSRLDRSALLDSPRRHQLLDAIRARPWCTIQDLERATTLPRSSIRHHLRMMAVHGLLAVQRTGAGRRFHERTGIALAACEGPVTELVRKEVEGGAQRLASVMRRLVAEHAYSRYGAWKAIRAEATRGTVLIERNGGSVWVAPTRRPSDLPN